jgi:hypothetical protein
MTELRKNIDCGQARSRGYGAGGMEQGAWSIFRVSASPAGSWAISQREIANTPSTWFSISFRLGKNYWLNPGLNF